jgi:hypothetical protein
LKPGFARDWPGFWRVLAGIIPVWAGFARVLRGFILLERQRLGGFQRFNLFYSGLVFNKR